MQQKLEPKFAWNDYFSGTPETTLSRGQFNSRQTLSVSSVYVSNCLFNKCTITNSDGGALYCTSVTYFFVESTSFFSCRTNGGRGGAIYFYNSNSLQSVLYAVCGYDCCTTTSYALFARVYIKDASSSKNYVNYTSIARCVNDTSTSHETLCLEWGRFCCPYLNLSMNKCQRYSGIYCYPSTDTSSVVCSLSYSTYANNSATQYNCILFGTGGSKYEIKSCNILRNIQGDFNSRGTIYASGNLMIEDSCILGNTATYIFYQTSSSYTITLSNCTVDSTSNNGYLTTKNTVTKSFILGLNHMSTQNCHAEYDSVGYLTPFIISQTSSKKQICCYTCGKFINHSPLRDFVLLTCASLVLKLLPQ
jgi:hypothetical protein